MRKVDYEPAPLLLAFVLGPLMESALRQSLSISHGSFSIFFTRPICAGSRCLAAEMITVYFLPSFAKKSETTLRDRESDE